MMAIGVENLREILKEALKEELSEELRASRFYNRFGFRTILPDQKGGRSCEVHSLMPFNDKLYVATGWGGGLYEIDEDFKVALLKKWTGGRDNFGRMWHKEKNLAIVGNFIVYEDGKVVDLVEKIGYEVFNGAVARDLTEPERYVFGSVGKKVYRVDLETLTAVEVADRGKRSWDMLTRFDKLWRCSTEFYPEFGNLESYDGTTWKTERTGQFFACFSFYEWSNNPAMFIGKDALSAFVDVTINGSTFTRYRLPFGLPNYELCEELRWVVRPIESFRAIANIAGILYELPCWYGGKGGDIKTTYGFKPVPICNVPWSIFDMCTFNGYLVIGVSESYPPEYHTGQPQSGLHFMPIEVLYVLGKPRGYGGVWKDTSVEADQYSDPFLIYGFDRKTIHLWTDTAGDFTIEVDPTGNGDWKTYDTVTLGAGEYTTYIMTGDAVWVRFKFSAAAKVGAWLVLG